MSFRVMNLDAVYPDAPALTRALAKLVYTDLLNDQRLSNIQPQFEANLKLFYLSADKESQQQIAYIPHAHSKYLDLELLQKLQNKLNNSSVFIAIADNTGNILYYQITEGIAEKL